MPKILIIDDDDTIYHVCKAYLSKAGYDVEAAMDGPEGLEKARSFQPDLVLLDINMPRMSGFEVAKRLKESPETRAIPIFMMTSLKQEANIERGYKLGIDDYITKPTNMAHLKLRIEKFLRKRN